MDNIYSAYHYACKTKADREAVEKLVPEIKETAEKAVFGNIGDIKYTTRTTVPNGGYWCDGQTITKSELSKVYDMLVSGELQCVDINTYNNVVSLNGSCGFFGLDLTNESFRVPLLDEVYIKSGQVADEFGAESLPNIEGGFTFADNIAKNSSNAQYVMNLNGAFRASSHTANTVIFANATITNIASPNRQVSFDASLSNETYQDGAKVNPDHVKYRAYVILYFAEKEMSIVDWTKQLEKKTNEGIAQIDAKADSYLDKTQITNCITEIPQDIKLELNDGTLTLKAGSKVYVPNGKNADGSLKFDVVVVESDMVFTTGASTKRMLFLASNGGRWNIAPEVCYSGNTAPSTIAQYSVWYDTANNIIRAATEAGSWSDLTMGLPLALATGNGESFSTINQVFNGFGYIGSTVFALPGVKGLIPNGRNEDGSLRNIEFVIDSVKTNTNTSNSDRQWIFYDGENLLDRSTNNIRYFDEKENMWWISDSYQSLCSVLTIKRQSGVVTGFSPKFTFRALDANEADYVTESYRSGANWFRKYKSGWLEQGGLTTISSTQSPWVIISFLRPFADTNLTVTASQRCESSWVWGGIQSGNVTTTSFLFAGGGNTNGDKTNGIYWFASGQGA